jgi:hypothetical protein
MIMCYNQTSGEDRAWTDGGKLTGTQVNYLDLFLRNIDARSN